MRQALPNLVRRHTRLLFATLVAIAIAASTALAQLGTFDPAFDGELWGVRHELVPANDGTPAGVVFVDGTLYVVDSAADTVIAYDAAGNVVPKLGAQWNAADSASPVSGMELHALGAAVVNVNGSDRNAILISDEAANRVAAFDTNGAHLFTLRLQRPETISPLLQLTIGQVAMSPGAKFSLNTSTQALSLNGTFVAGWYETVFDGTVDSGALIFPGTTVFVSNGAEFEATPDKILRGNEGDPVAPNPVRIFGVTFDTAGNLYVLDAFTERLHVYGPDFTRLFSFGTPIAGGGTAEFYEPWGLAYWPDANGGRLFIADTYNSRIVVYRPTDTPSSAPGIDALQLESVIKGFVASVPKLSVFTVAVEPSSGSIAVTDFADYDDGGHPRAIVLQQPNLAAFDLQVLDANNAVVQSVCAGADYKIRFSLTVPAGRLDVTNVLPQLSLNGDPTSASPVASASYPSPLTLSEGEVATFTYTLTAGTTIADITVLASASGDTQDVLGRAGLIFLADCVNETGASTLTATPNLPPQVSGWTPVLENQSFSITFDAEDPDGIETIEFFVAGANQYSDEPTAVEFDGEQTVASVELPMPELGRSTLSYRVRDGNGIWSPLQTLNVRTKLVVNRTSNENTGVEFRVGDPEGTGFTYSVSGLPPGASFATTTGQFAGVISFNAVDPYSANPIVASGVYPVVVTETAPGGATSSVSFTWTINHVNRPPIITNPPVLAGSLAINQGALFTMQITGMDPDGDPAVFTLHARGVNEGHLLPASITIDPVTGLISGIFPPDSDPAYDFSVGLAECSVQTVTPPCNLPPLEGDRLATFFDFQLAVLDVNEPADIVNPGPQTSAENESVTLLIQASDPNDDLLTFEAGGLPPGLSIARFDSETAVISGTVAWGSAGTYAVTVEADDHVNALRRSVTFSWLITHTNRPPTLTIPDKTSIETGPASGNVAAIDPDATDTLTYSAVGLPPGAFMNTSGVFSGGFDYDAAGVYPVIVTVSDGTAQAQDTFIWTVENVNRPPVLITPPRLSAEGDVVTVSLGATDDDGDALTYSYNGLPGDLSLDTATGQITGTFSYTSAGIYTVNVSVSDDHSGGSVLRTFIWTVTDLNPPPVVTTPGDQVNVEGDAPTVPVFATDPEGHALTFTALGLPPGLSIDLTTGVITGSLNYLSAGIYNVTVTVSDGMPANTRTVAFTWTVQDVNRPPVVTNPGDQTGNEGVPIVPLLVIATDPDLLDTRTFTQSGLPPGLSIDPLTGLITGTPSFTSAGTHTVTVRATDQGGLFDEETFTWTISDFNRPPVVTNPGNQTSSEGVAILPLQVIASDPDLLDNLTLTYSQSGLPAGLSIDASTGFITGTPTFDSAGTYTVTVTATDQGGLFDSQTFTWTVNNVNRPPVVTKPANQTGVENVAIAPLQVMATDPDSDTLTYSASSLPPGLSINSSTGIISGTPTFASAGTHTVTVKATDPGGLFDSKTFTWTITNVNRPPVVTAPATQTNNTGVTIVPLQVMATDPDSDTLTYSASSLPPGLSMNSSTGIISGTLTYTSAGTHTVTVTATDPGGLIDSKTFTWIVLASNVPPVCTAAAASPGVLWPPNHKPVYITLGGVVDPDGGTPSIKFTSVLQDEPTNTQGDGNTTQDAGIENNGAKVWVRAERMGGGNANVYGRVYIIGFTATDAQGAPCSGTVVVGVPHDQGNHNVPTPSPGRWNSVTGALVVAPPPNANNDSVSTKKNTAAVVAVQANDVVYGAVTLTIASQPASGTGAATVNANGTVTYTPATNWTGSTSFTYRLTNGAGSDTAVVSVTVKKK